MGLTAMTAIGKYNKHLDELTGPIDELLTALETGKFTDENGASLTDTITFQLLKKRLCNQ